MHRWSLQKGAIDPFAESGGKGSIMSIRGPRLKVFAAILAVIVLVFGIYSTFFRSRGFEKTSASIVSIEETQDSIERNSQDKDYAVTVAYTVEGVSYTALLDSYSSSYKVGKDVTILYDPNDPATVHSGQGFGIYAMVVGALILGGVLFSTVKSKKAVEQTKARQAERGLAIYAPSTKGEERELYFITDTGTAKVGHRIEDAQRRVLYEAKMTKFNVATPFAFDFIDHNRHTTTPHLVGHEERSEWDTLLLDNHYTFTFDGEDIWKHLKRNGVTVDSRLDSGNGRLIGTAYRISRDGEEIARVESASSFVHEEDAAANKVLSAVPMQGFYRLWTREENLDLLFVTLLAFARSGASDDKGGNYGTIFGTLKQK